MNTMNNKKQNKVPPLNEFLNNVRCHQANYGGSVFTTSSNGDSYEVARIRGIKHNISNHVDADEFDKQDVLDHTLDLTNFITDAIKEKINRDFKKKGVAEVTYNN